jgi:hypothetical protein
MIVNGPWPRGTLVKITAKSLVAYEDCDRGTMVQFGQAELPVMWLGVKTDAVPPDYSSLNEANRVLFMSSGKVWSVYFSSSEDIKKYFTKY